MNKMMSNANSSYTLFSSSSVTFVQTFANDRFKPRDSSELNDYYYCYSGYASAASTGYGGGADL